MTLPFRRRHNDAEASHDRARALIATGFLELHDPADELWLEAHLAGCAECQADAAAYSADRALVRTLRDQPPEPPRDLWARTAAAIQRERGTRGRGTRAIRAPRGWRAGRVPLGLASGLLVVLVVIGVSLAPSGIPLSPSASDVAVTTPEAQPTPLAVTADALAWIQVAPDGSYQFRRASLSSVCPDVRSGCAPLDSVTATNLALTYAPEAVVLSPTGAQIVVVTSSSSVGGAGVVVVSVPTAPPFEATPSPTVPDASLAPTPPAGSTLGPPPTLTPNPTPDLTLAPTLAPTPGSTLDQSPSLTPDASSIPSAGYSIASGVIVVGDAAYSPDGQWLAFSARPEDGSAGPDLYLWRVGDPLAIPVTTDHRTFFAGWLGNLVLANSVVPTIEEPLPGEIAPSPEPPTAPPTAPPPTATPDPGATIDPNATEGPETPVVEEHPIAFTLDPETGSMVPLAAQDMWHPSVDPTGRSVVYWSGTLIADGTGTGWVLGTGRYVLDGWSDGSEPSIDDSTAAPTTGTPTSFAPASAAPTTFAPTTVVPSSGDPTIEPSIPVLGPAGNPVTLAEGPAVDFDAWFDPGGDRLAFWLADPSAPEVGTLRMIVLDPVTREIDPTSDPLPGVAALRGVSINGGRLAWVTPPGQDGEGSHVQVLGWNGREFGQVRTIEAGRLFVAR